MEPQAALTLLLRALRAGARSLDALSRSDDGTSGLQGAGEVLIAVAGLAPPNHPPRLTPTTQPTTPPIHPPHPTVAGLEGLLRGLDVWGAAGPPTASALDAAVASEPAPHRALSHQQSPACSRSRSRSRSRGRGRSRSRSRSRSTGPWRIRTGFDQQEVPSP